MDGRFLTLAITDDRTSHIRGGLFPPFAITDDRKNHAALPSRSMR